jgi:hypothetical protein
MRSIMASGQILLVNEFAPSSCLFGKPRTLANGGKTIFVNAPSGGPLLLQLPECPTPFGISRWDNNSGATVSSKHTLDLSLRGWNDQTTTKATVCYEKLARLDELVMATAIGRCVDWLNKKTMPADLAKALYTPTLRFTTNDKYPPRIKITLPTTRDGRIFTCDAYDTRGNPLDLANTNLTNASVTAIVQCTGIWVAAGRFGISWKALQLRVKLPCGILSGAPAFRRDAEDDAYGASEGHEILIRHADVLPRPAPPPS